MGTAAVLTCAEQTVFLLGLLQLFLEQPQLPLELRFLFLQAGIVNHCLQSFPQQLLLLSQQRNLLLCRVQLNLEDGNKHVRRPGELKPEALSVTLCKALF